MEKLTKEQFCTLMKRREDMKRLKKQMERIRENSDLYAVSEMRDRRISRKANIII